MSHEWLSGEQVGRYGRFVADPTPEELERFFFLDEAALAEVPEVVIRYAAEQLWVQEWTAVKQYGDRPQTPYDHAARIRDQMLVKQRCGRNTP